MIIWHNYLSYLFYNCLSCLFVRNCLEQLETIIKVIQEKDERMNFREDERASCKGKGQTYRRKKTHVKIKS